MSESTTSRMHFVLCTVLIGGGAALGTASCVSSDESTGIAVQHEDKGDCGELGEPCCMINGEYECYPGMICSIEQICEAP